MPRLWTILASLAVLCAAVWIGFQALILWLTRD